MRLGGAPGYPGKAEGVRGRGFVPGSLELPEDTDVRHVLHATGRLQGRTLLLIDDERPVLQGVAAMLRLAGCQAILAATGHEALALCDRHAEGLAAVILDLHLPGEDSSQLFDALRARTPDLPIILMSGVSEAAARERIGRTDIAGFVPKPFRMDHLLKTVEGALAWPPTPVDPPAPSSQVTESGSPPEAPGVSGDAAPVAEPFRVWLLRRVAEAARRGEVPDQVLARLQAEFEAGGGAAADLPHSAAVREIAELAGIPPGQAADVLAALQQLPGVAQERLIRRIAEAWLDSQRQRHLGSQQPEEAA